MRSKYIPVWLTFTLARGNHLFAPGGSGSSETVLHLPHIIPSHLTPRGNKPNSLRRLLRLPAYLADRNMYAHSELAELPRLASSSTRRLVKPPGEAVFRDML
ncbi:hypothetical protein F4805DRAFT_169153 [Annulohypoxylon moriforme]|nr:hypothetical protein F4805DRAFT_169153 [Annulohypoxylon moriforme]